jgi:hypothetical protein
MGYLAARHAPGSMSSVGEYTYRMVYRDGAWAIVLPMLSGALLFYWLAAPHTTGMVFRLLGDHLNVAFGGVGLTAGLVKALSESRA